MSHNPSLGRRRITVLSACMPIYYGYLLLIVNSTDYLSNTYYFSYMLLYFNIFHTFAIANPSPAKRWIFYSLKSCMEATSSNHKTKIRNGIAICLLERMFQNKKKRVPPFVFILHTSRYDISQRQHGRHC